MRKKKKAKVKQNMHTVKYVCSNCDAIENIGLDVLDYFDEINPQQLIFGAHKFSCENCNMGVMEPEDENINKSKILRIYKI